MTAHRIVRKLMSSMFHFKQFSIDQTDCAMKVNTDGVLLAALTDTNSRAQILDIGTGTGLISLMLAQKFPESIIDAVEIDEKTAETARLNFENSPFSKRIKIFHNSIENYFKNENKKYDLIISNPPFFIDSLRSNDPLKLMARHTDITFFEQLLSNSFKQLNTCGILHIILPLNTSSMVKKLCIPDHMVNVQKETHIHSFPDSKPHRTIMSFGFESVKPEIKNFVIYEKAGIYTSEYRNLLKDYLTIF